MFLQSLEALRYEAPSNPMRNETARISETAWPRNCCMASREPLLCGREEILQVPTTSERAARSEAESKTSLQPYRSPTTARERGDDVLDSVPPVCA